MAVLSQGDLNFWEEHGYLVVPNVVPQRQLDAVVGALWNFLDMRPRVPETWYSLPPWHSKPGMVELYHHQALWDNRQHPNVHQIFSEIHGTEELWVSLDRVNMNPPVQEKDAYSGFIHWDFDPTSWPIPLRVQGVLCLEETTVKQGGFQCVPRSHKRVQEILAWQAPGQNLRNPDIGNTAIVPVPGQPGDLVIWHMALLHGNGPNHTDRPRLAQYITMSPAQPAAVRLRQSRVHAWRRRLPMGYMTPRAFPADIRRIDELQPHPAHLTTLGRKLVGVDLW